MKLKLDPKKALANSLTALVLLFAVWLVSPFFRNDMDAAHGTVNSYRLFFGLMIMIGFVGKSLWDVLAPQGLARKVSSTQAVLIVAVAIVVMGFVVFIVAKAVDSYLNSAYETDKANYTINNNLP